MSWVRVEPRMETSQQQQGAWGAVRQHGAARVLSKNNASFLLLQLLLKHISVKYSSITAFKMYLMVFFFLICNVFLSWPVMCRLAL